MPFQRPTLTELVDRVEGDLTTRLPLSGGILRRSVVAVLARVLAGAVHLLHGHLEYLSRQVFPDTSEADFLERHASLFGLSRTPATYAAGTVTATGTDDTVIPAGTLLQRADGAEYQTNEEAVIAGGTAAVPVAALVAGLDGQADAGVTLAFLSPIAGVSAIATVAGGGLTGGADAELDDSLRARLLDRLRQPPHGGARADYIRWGLEVPGVTRVWVFPLEDGPGTVTVRFVRDDDEDLIPSAGEVEAVQDYIDERRPVTADVTVAAPTPVDLDVTVAIVPDTAATRAAVQAELVDMLRRTAAPGSTILLSQIKLAIGSAAGVDDFTVTVPAANVTHAVGEIAVLGDITWA